MKILHLLSSRGWGGAENNAVYIAKKQLESGHNVFFFIHSFNSKLINLLNNYDIPYFSIFDPERKNILAIKKIIGVCKKERIDIIHTHLGTGNYLGVIAGNYINIPAASSINIFSGYPYYGSADGLFFTTEAVKRYFVGYFSSDIYKKYKPSVFENFINKIYKLNFKPEDINEIMNKSYIVNDMVDERLFVNYSGADDNKNEFKDFFNIGITGRLTEQKGHIYFIEAAELMIKSNVEYERNLMFHIVGSGEDKRKILKILKKKGISTHFKLWGYQSDIRKIVNLFDVAVSCSLNEPFGINNLEYMLLKKPCIATNTGGIPEVYGDTNILIPPKNALKLKEAIEAYLANPDLMKEESDKGFLRTSKLFNSDAILQKILNTYSCLIELRQGRLS